MEVFTYLKRVNSIETLNKLVINIESYTPTLLKYIALRTVNLKNKKDKIEKNKEKEIERIVEVIENQVNKVDKREWLPSEVVSVMNLFSNTQPEIKKETKEFIERKIGILNNYNMYDIVQMLKTVKRIKVRLNIEELKEYIEKNIETLLKQASLVNIYSMLNELAVNGVKLSNKTIEKIVEHIEEEGKELEFKEVTNTYNSLSRHINIGTEKIFSGENGENKVEKAKNMIETLYNKVLIHIEEGNDDFEGIVDVLDGTVNIMNVCNINKRESKESSTNSVTSARRNTAQVSEHSNKELLRRCEMLIDRLKYHFNNSLEPKLIRILLRNISTLRYYDEELMEMIIGHYKSTHRKWSLQGNIDLLNAITHFKMEKNSVFFKEFQIEKWIECVNKYKQIMKESHINQIYVNLSIYKDVNKEELMDSIIRSGLVGERELSVGMMISKINGCKLERLSLESLNVLNSIKLKVEPENIISEYEEKDVGKIIDKLKYKNNKTNLNFVNFCNFNFV